MKSFTNDDLRSLLFEIENQDMTIAELRRKLFEEKEKLNIEEMKIKFHQYK